MNKNKNTKIIASAVGAHDCARDHKGITLVALIITVIVMLILLGVTVNIALNGGLFGMTKEAVKKTEIAAYKEKIDAVRINIIVEQISKGLTTEEFMNRYEEELRKDKNFEGSEITREGETIILTTKEGYVFEITEEGTNYEVDTDVPETPKNPPSLSKNNITYDPETWTQGPVTVEISTTEEGYTLEYRIVKADGTTIQDWTPYLEQLTVENNETMINARLKDESSKKVGGVATANITNIDRLDPDSVTISSTEKTTNSITIVAEATDADAITTGEKTDGKSEIAKYYFSKDNGDTWEPKEGQASGTYTFTELTPGKTYTIKVKAEDNAENSTTSEGKSVTTLQYPLYKNELLDETTGVLTTNATYIDEKNEIAVVPKGFKIAEEIGEKPLINDGLVIQDKDENQFVWIPVKVTERDTEADIESFCRSSWADNERKASLKDHLSYLEPYTSGGLKDEEKDYNDMVKSVYTNKGFYIGRYEAGSKKERTNTSNKTTEMVVKQGAFPYNYVGWGASMSDYTSPVEYNGKDQGKGAVLLSEEMYQNKDVGVTSTLCYGVQWDAMLDFIKDDEHIVTNSTSWGHYNDIDKGVATTGSSDKYSAKNIYDVAGNVAEWTMEAYLNQNQEKRMYRGGSISSNTDSAYRASYRNWWFPAYCEPSIGFRPALYINRSSNS